MLWVPNSFPIYKCVLEPRSLNHRPKNFFKSSIFKSKLKGHCKVISHTTSMINRYSNVFLPHNSICPYIKRGKLTWEFYVDTSININAYKHIHTLGHASGYAHFLMQIYSHFSSCFKFHTVWVL